MSWHGLDLLLLRTACAPVASPAFSFLTPPTHDRVHAATYEIASAGPAGARTVGKGNTVTVHATGVVAETGKQFWCTKDAGQQPFTYQAGVGGVITGWDQGCLGMALGEVRTLRIPAKEGYGAGGFPAWGIPPAATLLFTLECLSIA